MTDLDDLLNEWIDELMLQGLSEHAARCLAQDLLIELRDSEANDAHDTGIGEGHLGGGV